MNVNSADFGLLVSAHLPRVIQFGLRLTLLVEADSYAWRHAGGIRLQAILLFGSAMRVRRESENYITSLHHSPGHDPL